MAWETTYWKQGFLLNFCFRGKYWQPSGNLIASIPHLDMNAEHLPPISFIHTGASVSVCLLCCLPFFSWRHHPDTVVVLVIYRPRDLWFFRSASNGMEFAACEAPLGTSFARLYYSVHLWSPLPAALPLPLQLPNSNLQNASKVSSFSVDTD